MDRSAYNKCMIPFMKGGGENKKLRFCIGAKLCSGKSKTEEEAREVCSLPKEPKISKTRTRSGRSNSCEKNVVEITQCMMNYFEANKIYKQILNINSVETAIANALLECQCQK